MAICNIFENCFWFEGGDKRNTIASMGAGFLFFLGWWIVIDSAAKLTAAHHVCGLLGTLSLFMVNSVTNAQVRGDAYTGGCMGSRGARIWVFVGFVLGFASVIAAVWIMIEQFAAESTDSHRGGIALLLQNVFIFLATVIFKFGRSEDLWG